MSCEVGSIHITHVSHPPNAPSARVGPTPSSHGQPWRREGPGWSQMPDQDPRSGVTEKPCPAFLPSQYPLNSQGKLAADGEQGGAIPSSPKIQATGRFQDIC